MDPWQQLVVDGFLLERPGGQWAAIECGLEVPRQNGKNVIQEVIELAGLVLLDERLITHSAHQFNTATEHFIRMRHHIETSPVLQPLLDDIYTANGKESIILKGGRRLKFFARSRGGGRGFTGDRLVFDEAFSLDAAAMGAMFPALSARSMEVPGPQVMYFSSAGHSDSAVLHNVRKRALAGSDRLAYFGWLNEPGTDREDRDAWYRANPGLGIRITEEWVETELDALAELGDEFDRERLGVPSPQDSGESVFGQGKWAACVDDRSTMVGDTVVRSGCRAGDGVGVVRGRRVPQRRPPPRRARSTVIPVHAWVAARARELQDRWKAPIGYDPHSPVKGLVPNLEKQGVELVPLPAGGMTQACANLQDAVINGSVRHLTQGPVGCGGGGRGDPSVGRRMDVGPQTGVGRHLAARRHHRRPLLVASAAGTGGGRAARRMAVTLAAVGAVSLIVGAALIYVPAGFITAGLVLLAAAYVWRFLEVQQ